MLKKTATLIALGLVLSSTSLPALANTTTATEETQERKQDVKTPVTTLSSSDKKDDTTVATSVPIIPPSEPNKAILPDAASTSDSKQNIQSVKNIQTNNSPQKLQSAALMTENTSPVNLLNDNESLDSWMPDTNLQDFLVQILGVPKSQLTKELLSDTDLPVNYDNGLGRDFFYLPSYKGLEYFKSISVELLDSQDMDSLNYLEAHPINWTPMDSLQNMTIIAHGYLPAIFPNGINMQDSRIQVDPHNVYFMNDIYLNQLNYKSFYLSYSKLKLLNIDFASIDHITKVNFESGSYTAIPTKDGIQFTLSPFVNYADLAGKEFIETDKSINFPNGPYALLSYNEDRSTKDINLRINLHFANTSGNVTVNYIDQDNVKLSPEQLLVGGVGENYQTEQLAFPGYSLKEVAGAVSGQFTDQPQTVTYKYVKTPLTGVAGGNITTRYVDTNGTSISDDIVTSGNIGDPYSTVKKDIAGFTYKNVTGNTSGQFTNQLQTVTYIYTSNSVPSTGSNPSVGSKVTTTVTKSPTNTLPQTGENQSNSPLILLLGFASVILAGTLSVLKLRTKK
ncbi:hypothetical protein RU86_GL001424 [Lactococcus piscium]|uniref:Gram-positive cocci surface proteins LPxTG domain-containing protein n=1 Tax=Pseudolactococcus piscium TaxID=1364 RepID=A0A2A5S4H5_9LACT|nr:MucBP domain-containing protein [Lactococcus piscium]PCS08399.1 hypothetical protein RU86_GL001424 [Lactococcus piscium]